MTHKLINRLEKRRASRKMHSVPHSLLLTSYFLILTSYFLLLNYYLLLPKATAQQSRNPIPDTECQCGGGALTPTPTNAGTNFLLCFEENTNPYYNPSDSADGYLGIYCASMGDLAYGDDHLQPVSELEQSVCPGTECASLTFSYDTF